MIAPRSKGTAAPYLKDRSESKILGSLAQRRLLYLMEQVDGALQVEPKACSGYYFISSNAFFLAIMQTFKQARFHLRRYCQFKSVKVLYSLCL